MIKQAKNAQIATVVSERLKREAIIATIAPTTATIIKSVPKEKNIAGKVIVAKTV